MAISLVILSSAFVRNEPAPYDLLIFIIGSVCFLFGYVKPHPQLIIAYLLLLTFVIANFIPLIGLPDERLIIAITQSILTVYMILTWIFFAGLIKQYEEDIFLLIMNSYAVCGAFSAFLGVTAYLHLIPYADLFIWNGSRAVGFFKDPNVFGPFLIPVCIYALYKIIQTDFKRWHWFFVLGVCFLGVILSFSRAAWVALTIAIIVFLFFPGLVRLRQKLIIASLTLVIGIFTIVFALQNEQAARLLSGRSGLQEYDNERFATQSSALEIAYDNPLGIGGKQTDFLFGLPPHNLYVTSAAEYGWLGFLSLIGFMLLSFQNALRSALFDHSSRKPLHGIVVASIAGMLVGVLTIDPLHWRHFWLLFALAWLPISRQQRLGGPEHPVMIDQNRTS
jgi:O-antigen ligase